MRSSKRDPVPPEVREYVLRRDRFRCVVELLATQGAIPPQRDCRDRYGDRIRIAGQLDSLTVAHVRDRGKGGRMGRRPPSVPRHLATVCWGHHVLDPVVDHGDVRDALDAHLALLEGGELPDGRPWEVVRRVRGDRDAAS